MIRRTSGRVLTLIVACVVSAQMSCWRENPKELAKLPARYTGNCLDSSQAWEVFKRARYYPNGTALSMCILEGDSDIYIGIERRNDSLVYIENRDSVFEIGSITKTFTGTILAKLVYEGRVRPEDPIQKFLPVPLHQSSLNGEEVRLVHLANHTSGLPFEPANVREGKEHAFDPYDPYKYYSTEALHEYLSNEMVLVSTPGERRLYSNLGGGLLGYILTCVTKKSYEELVSESICTPLGMQHTFVELRPERERWMVQGRDQNGRPLPFGGGDCGALAGCGGIKSSARDLVKYIRANMRDTTYFDLAQKTTKQFDEHLTGSLAWATYSENGSHHVGAFGATGGYTCGLIFERSRRVGIVLLTNVSAFMPSQENNVERLCRALYDPLVSAGRGKN